MVLPLLSSLIALVFAITVFDQFLERRRPYQLVWTVGLLCYAIATGMEFLSGAFGTAGLSYRLWYLFGAVFSAAYLGIGTLYLLTPRRAAHTVMALLFLASLFAIYKVFSAPVDLSQLGATLSGAAFPRGWAGPRSLTPYFNIFGTVALVGGALWSALVYWRRQQHPQRVRSNILIAIGALLPASGGTLARLGSPQFLYLSELMGIVIIFLGFLLSREVVEVRRLPFTRGRKA